MSVFMNFMHYAMLSTCGCTYSMLLSISIVFARWGAFGKEELVYIIVQEKLKYFLIWLEGIYVFYVFIWRIVTDLVFLYFEVWVVSQVFSRLKFDEIETLYFLWLYMKEIFKDYDIFMKGYNFVLLLFIFIWWMICKGLCMTSERSSTPIAIWHCPYLLGCGFEMWHKYSWV